MKEKNPKRRQSRPSQPARRQLQRRRRSASARRIVREQRDSQE